MAGSELQSTPRLGFIGLGAMGSRMAQRLLAAGYNLTVHDRTREQARPLEQSGAKFAASHCHSLLPLMVHNPAANCREAALGA
jgi:3-hydroxyisobutyrate dehydrogenase-like beta-hydroxyacid dehydrogenase